MSPTHGKGRMAQSLGTRDPRVRRGMNQFDRPDLILGDGLEVSSTGRLIQLALASSSGLEFTSGALRIDIAASQPLSLGAGGLSVTTGITAGSVAAGDDDRFLTSMEPSDSQRIFRSVLSNASAALTTVSATAYFVYLGRTVKSITPKYVEFHVSGAGAGTQAAEVGIYSSIGPPNKSARVLSKIIATATVDDLTTTGVKRNTSAFSTAIAADSHLWAALRVTMGTTQPDIIALANDFSQGHVMSMAGSSPSIIGLATGAICPDLRAVLD